MHGDGSILIHQDDVFRVKLPKVEVKNPVGSGDELVAVNRSIKTTRNNRGLKIRNCMRNANAMEEGTGESYGKHW